MHILEFLTETKNPYQMEDINYVMTTAHSPQTG